MKKHAIIPIFIPHQGCPNDCVFCNQKKITARQPDMTRDEIINTIETWLSTLTGRPGIETVEIAFFGGSFTGIPLEKQSEYLKIAYDYKARGLVQKIHLSTRPDYIDPAILDNLKAFSVDVIELGVQSFDDRVLQAAGRGHDSAAVYRACRLIQSYGFELGIQLMIGLPEDSKESCLYSAKETVKIGPSIARLYPTVILKDTKLMELYKAGSYRPLSEQEAVETTKEMYQLLTASGINIIRVGLKSSDLIQNEKEVAGHTFHPAFRQLVEGEIAREKMQVLLEEALPHSESAKPAHHSVHGQTPVCPKPPNEASTDRTDGLKVTFYSSPGWFSNMIGHKGCNKSWLAAQYSDLKIRYKTLDLEDGCIALAVAGNSHLVVK